ncbi:SatD family (SatD) [Friedmanniella luteola]|uniref:SatD family (SatD) n=1 Tax=Friedmanniella luteola TaxID=546871 RepID=A0A1H1PTW0_9ACTN|nr:SatD family protein [Friedmanniella luteola]SDS14556.1 SatD family (SatD) [Friedmanniella luteola]
MFVLTVDQIDSRRHRDLVEPTLARLAALPARLPFTRTVGDEFQGVLADGRSVVDAILMLMRTRTWHVGLGIGAVEEPLPGDPRSARGPAFLAARSAVEQAKREPGHVHVAAPAAPDEGEDVAVVLQLLAALRERRTASGWEAVDLMGVVGQQADVADQLGVTRQAVGQRLQAAGWSLEQRTLPTLARLLDRADSAAGGRS